MKTEKLVCVSGYNRKKVFGVLSRSVHCHPNLQFQGLFVGRRSVQFWKKCGHEIHSLDFINCRFSKKAARSVICRCDCLKYLSLQSCSGFFSCHVFDYCMKKAIRRTNLKSIKVGNDADMSDYIFKQIFQVYPHIKSIAVSLVNDRLYNTVYKDAYFEQITKSRTPVYESKNIFSHSAIHERLRVSSDMIQDLEYIEVDRDVSHMHSNFFDAIYHNPNLKLRSIFFSPSSFNIPSQSALSAFFVRQDKLEHVVLKKNHFNNQCCSLILDNCVNLRYLELVDSDVGQDSVNYAPIILCQDIFEKFVSSKLRSLKLHFDFRLEELEPIRSVEINDTLRYLSINSNSILRKNISMLIEAFQSLTCLDLSNSNLDDALMQIILRYQVR